MTERLLSNVKISYIAIAAFLLYAFALSPGISTNGDDSAYILMSRAFLEKGFFHEAFVSGLLVKSYYYCLLPVLLMPFNAAAPDNFLLMKTVPLFAAVLSVIALDHFLKGLVSEGRRKAVVMLYAFNPWVAEYSGMILTDMPFVFFLLGAAFFAKRYASAYRLGDLLPAAVFSALSVYTRPFGLPLAAALLAFLFIRKRFADLAIAVAVLAVLCVPILWNVSGISEVFITNFIQKQDYYSARPDKMAPAGIVFRSGYNLLVYAGNYLPDLMLRPLVSSIDPRLPDRSVNTAFIGKFAAGMAMSFLMLKGFRNTLRRGMQVYHIYAVLHVAVAAVIGVYVARYILPLLPFMIFFLFEGMSGDGFAAKRGPAPHAAFAAKSVSVAFAFLLAVSLYGTSCQIADIRSGRIAPEVRSFIECNDWIRSNTGPDSVIVSRKPTYTEVYAGRKSFCYLFSPDSAAQISEMEKNNAEYVIVGDLGFYLNDEAYISAAINRYPERFELVYTTDSNPEDYIYRFRR